MVLTNGVGTDFFMWLPTVRFMIHLYPTLFDEITLLVPSYRGLFQTDDVILKLNVKITIDNCVEDLRDILSYFKLPYYHAIIGIWLHLLLPVL